MKRYIVFCGEAYYPCGTLDIQASFDDLEEMEQ